jgi:hypothetical protein
MVRYSVRLSCLVIAVCWAQPQETVKYGVKVQPGPMDTVLLKDYRPESSLVVPETRVEKARFPVIDVHTHTFMSNIRTPADVDEWVRTMDEVGVEKSIVFHGRHRGRVRPTGRAVSETLSSPVPALVRD